MLTLTVPGFKFRHILIITPANLRKQWSQELADKFFLQSTILEAKSFNQEINRGNLNPFLQPNIVLCSYQFARTKEPYLRQVPWDLVVIDEAHRLRNVYKPQNKIANALKNALQHAPKILLTATPLQNSLLEFNICYLRNLKRPGGKTRRHPESCSRISRSRRADLASPNIRPC